MKKINVAVLIVLMTAFTASAAQEELQIGMILPNTKIVTGTKAPPINYQDTTGTVHQLHSIIGYKYTLIVFTGERTCANRNSPLIETAKALFRSDAPATIVEIVGGEKGCEPVQKADVLQRSVSGANLFTLCDVSGDTIRRYGVNDLTALYLIDPSGKIVETAPYSKLDALLARTNRLSSELESELSEFYD